MTMPSVIERGWSRRFDEPIPLPKGRQLVTLKDAGTYITKPSEVGAHGAGVAGGNASLNLGGDARRADDARTHRHHESVEPQRCARRHRTK